MNLRPLLLIIASFLLWSNAWSAEDYQAPKTEWGQPDLQGVWNFSSDIPMQRPSQYGEREYMTEEEIAECEQRLEILGHQLGDPEVYKDGERMRTIEGERSERQERADTLYRDWERYAAEIEAIEDAAASD